MLRRIEEMSGPRLAREPVKTLQGMSSFIVM